jgi:hypothetical protein
MSTTPNTFEPQGVHQEYHPLQNHAIARYTGEVTLWDAVKLVEEAMSRALKENTGRLLVNISALTGFPSPNLADRYFIARKLAQHAQGHLKLALVIRRQMIDPERFGVMVARNSGLITEVSDKEDDALAWLLAD